MCLWSPEKEVLKAEEVHHTQKYIITRSLFSLVMQLTRGGHSLDFGLQSKARICNNVCKLKFIYKAFKGLHRFFVFSGVVVLKSLPQRRRAQRGWPVVRMGTNINITLQLKHTGIIFRPVRRKAVTSCLNFDTKGEWGWNCSQWLIHKIKICFNNYYVYALMKVW